MPLSLAVIAAVLRLLAKRMVLPALVLLSTTAVAAVTGALKVAPSLWVSVRVWSDALWPIEPVTLTAPAAPAFKVSDWLLALVPLTAPLRVKAPPAVLSVKWLFNTNGVLLSPKVMAVLTVLTVPPKLRLLGAVTTKPLSKVKTSEAESPSVKMPVFKKDAAPLTCVLSPPKTKW